MLLYEMKFLVPNYNCLQNPWLGGYCPQIPVLSVLCPELNLLNPSRTKFLGTPLSQSTSVFSCQYHFTIAPYSSSSDLLLAERQTDQAWDLLNSNGVSENRGCVEKKKHDFSPCRELIRGYSRHANALCLQKVEVPNAAHGGTYCRT